MKSRARGGTNTQGELVEVPLGVSSGTWRLLRSHIASALRQKNARGADSVRKLVFAGATEMRSAGASWDAIESAISRAVTEHPDVGAFDCLNVMSGKRTSDALIAWMIGWVRRVRQLDDPMAARKIRSTGDRINVQKAETVLEQLPPVLDRHLSLVRTSDPDARHEELMDRALKQAVMDLHFTLNRQTFEYLRWRVERAHASYAEALAAAQRRVADPSQSR